jgi:hypothetical protein
LRQPQPCRVFFLAPEIERRTRAKTEGRHEI